MLLGKTIYSEAGEQDSNQIMKHLYTQIKGIKFSKRRDGVKQTILNYIARDNVRVGPEIYRVEFGKVHHANGIGNNNEWPTYLVNDKEKCLVGSVFVLWPIFGDTCEVSVKNIKGERLNV